MAFKIVKTLPAVEWPVVLPEPKNGGGIEKHEVTLTFKQLRDDELQERYGKQSKSAFLRDVITNWGGFVNEDGSEAPFCEETLTQVLTTPWARDAMFEAYQSMILGISEKN